MNSDNFDVIVIGGGIAGASAAAELSRTHRVCVLEREAFCGYHSTGRSAALFSETYGNDVIRALSRASRSFLFAPPAGFCAHPLVKPRGTLHIAREDQIVPYRAFLAELEDAPNVRCVDRAEARKLSPALRAGYAAWGVHDPDAADVDVHELHQGYLRAVKRNGGALITDAEILALDWHGRMWRTRTKAGAFAAPVVVNAAGAWADIVADIAGAARCGVAPKRRTAVLAEVPDGLGLDAWPLTIDIEENFYFKPDAGLLLLSPADETPVPPCDVQPEEIDVATAIDAVERATTLTIERVRKRWAGLRSFAPDRSPVIGFDPARPGFFWLAGQGGYGIQTAPAAARLAATLVRGEAPAQDLAGVDLARVSPVRFAMAARNAAAGE